jgi:hypothetical protein
MTLLRFELFCMDFCKIPRESAVFWRGSGAEKVISAEK